MKSDLAGLGDHLLQLSSALVGGGGDLLQFLLGPKLVSGERAGPCEQQLSIVGVMTSRAFLCELVEMLHGPADIMAIGAQEASLVEVGGPFEALGDSLHRQALRRVAVAALVGQRPVSLLIMAVAGGALEHGVGTFQLE